MMMLKRYQNELIIDVFKMVENVVIETESSIDELAIMINSNRKKLDKSFAITKKHGLYNNITIDLSNCKIGYFDIEIFEFQIIMSFKVANFIS